MESASPERIEAAAGRPQPISFRGKARITRRAIGLILGLIVCIPFHYLWRLLHLGSPWPKWFLHWAGYCSGARVRRVGTPLKRDVFYISNHCSWLDITSIAGTSGTAFVAKAELRAAPVVGWLASLNRTVFVAREDRLGVAEQINRLREALAENWSVTVFPEGTTTDGRSMLPFKAPLLKVLEPPPPGILVQPVMLDYGDVGPDIGWIGEEHGKDNALRVLARRGSFPVTVHFLEPFHPRDFPGRKAIAAESQRRIREALAEAMGHPVPMFIGHDVWSGKIPHPDAVQSAIGAAP
jgi:1-acyl-sn-glycerol-3-phosphate acyltransferase